MIRPATPDDHSEIAAMLADFHAAAGSQYTNFDRESALKTIDHLATLSTGAVLVAEQEKRLYGVIAGIIIPVFVDFSQLQAHEAFMWVRPEARGVGAGAGLIAGLEAWAQARGAKTLTMVAFHGSDADGVGALYRRRGYAPFEYHFIKELTCILPSSS